MKYVYMYVVEEVVEADGALQNAVEESACGVLGIIPQGFENVVAFVVIPSVEERHCFVEAADFFIFIVVVGDAAAAGGDPVGLRH